MSVVSGAWMVESSSMSAISLSDDGDGLESLRA